MKLAEGKKKSVYLDESALCRSFDEQEYVRIRMETAAVDLIIEHVRSGDYELYYSPVHRLEIAAIGDSKERSEIHDLLIRWGTDAGKRVSLKATRQRAEELVAHGFGVADAAHAAFAEAIQTPFITCDDRLIKLCRKHNVGPWCGTPVEFCELEGIR